jgi:SNF2 family DNA or RNA helicase
MLVIHGIWANGALCLWAEDSRRPARVLPPPAGRRPSRAPRPHPFAGAPDVLAEMLAVLPEPFPGLARKAVEDELTLYLPARADGPLASPELTRPAGGEDGQPAGGAGRVTLTPWRVPALIFEPAAALDLLAALDILAAPAEPGAADVPPAEMPGPDLGGPEATGPDPGLTEVTGPDPGVTQMTGPDPGLTEVTGPDPGVTQMTGADLGVAGVTGPGIPDTGPGAVTAVAGGSAVYWSAVAALAGDLAGQGRVLPVLEAEDTGYAARWRPVLSGAGAQWARELAAAMPPLCRATQPAGEPPALVLAAALDALSDAAARARLDRARSGWALLSARRGRRPSRAGVAERWAEALTGADARITITSPEDSAEAAELASALADWRTAAQAPAGPVRTCFRLVEPAPDEGHGEPTPGEGLSEHAPGEGLGEHASCDDAAAADDGSAESAVDDGLAEASPDDAGDKPGAVRSGEMSAADGKLWTVEFALQSTDDPSLMIPAADIWAGVAGAPVGGITHPEEALLTGLGGAARLFPELDAELRRAAPAAATLDTAGAFRFLKETGPLLSGAGFGVLLPDWARKARLGLKLTSRSASTGAAGGAVKGAAFGLNDLVDFRYDLAVGDQALDPDELAELARLKIPLVRIRGQWVELDERNLRAAMRFLERGQDGVMRAGDALLAGLRGPEDDLPVTAVDADGWLGDLLSGQADRRITPITAPQSFRGTLRPYQERGVAWLSFLSNLGMGGILADSMGLGKTIQMLALLAYEREPRGPTEMGAPVEDWPTSEGSTVPGPAGPLAPTLLVCPMSLVGNWQREAERFTPHLAVHVHHGSDRLTGDGLTQALNAADLVITTYAIAVRDRDALATVNWGRVVCDEAQNIKNPGTRQARAVRSLPAASRIALTGTPVENRLAELWSIMEFARPGLLGPGEKFRTEFAIPVERHGDEDASGRLRRLTGPFILRRVKTDKTIISDLPEKQEMKVWCNLTPEQASLYQATVADMLARIEAAEEGIERRGLVLATMAKLKQVCNHPAHLLGDSSRLPGRSGKLARLEEICDEIVAAGERALCFTQYAEFARLLQPHLAARLGCPVLFLHGGTPKKRRDTLVEEFQGLNEPAVFLLSLKAGGTGLNLTAANHVIHVDRWWNPAVEDQATDRAFRIGQRKDVQVRKFVCVGTLEERIDAMIEEKKALAERIVGTGEGWLTELSVADLREVLALSPEAVSQ